MNEQSLQKQIDDINRKLDLVLGEMLLQQRQRREFEDLRDDLLRVGKDVYRTGLFELDDLHDEVNTGDVWYLGKRLLRNVNMLSAIFGHVESLRDFLRDAAPLARESFIDGMNALDELDRKGYFTFMKELGKVADNIVTSFSKEDIRALGDNIVTILNTVKQMTQPDLLHAVKNAVEVYRKLDVEVTEEVSLISLLKELNSPETRKGMAFVIRFLKNLSTHADTTPLPA